MDQGREITVNACKYDGIIRRTWSGGLVSETDDLIVLVGYFSEDVEHNDLGHIRKGTVSFEHYWLSRWYNIFRFHEPDGKLLAHYANIAMPATLEGDVLTYIDLDIDVIRWPDGRVEVLDRDDLEKNSVKFGYTDETLQRVERGLSEVLGMIDRSEFPFNTESRL